MFSNENSLTAPSTKLIWRILSASKIFTASGSFLIIKNAKTLHNTKIIPRTNCDFNESTIADEVDTAGSIRYMATQKDAPATTEIRALHHSL